MKIQRTLFIQCSRCGKREEIPFYYSFLVKATMDGWNSYGSALYCPECTATWHDRNDKELAGPSHTLDVFDEWYDRQTRPYSERKCDI